MNKLYEITVIIWDKIDQIKKKITVQKRQNITLAEITNN